MRGAGMEEVHLPLEDRGRKDGVGRDRQVVDGWRFGRCGSDGVGWMLDSICMSFWTVLCVCARYGILFKGFPDLSWLFIEG